MVLEQKVTLPESKLLDVGGHRLAYTVLGEGTPIVVLEGGLGSPLDFWLYIQQGVAQFTRVVAYERAGLGQSESSGQLPEAHIVAEQLHVLLDRANIPAPYIMVGHSLGGIYIRWFAHQYPDEVVGLGLVDASHPEQFSRLPAALSLTVNISLQLYRLAALLAKFGIAILPGLAKKSLGKIPPEIEAKLTDYYSSPSFLRALVAETNALPAICAQGRATGNVGNKPLFVITAGSLKGKAGQVWRQLQAELAALSTNSTHRVVNEATHISLGTNPQHAQIVVEAIQRVVQQVRTEKEALASLT